MSDRETFQTPPAWRRGLAVLMAAMVMTWAALANGGPFFTPDTEAYVRGPDVAVVKLFGERFSTPWARMQPPGAAAVAAKPGAKPQHSYDDKEVLAGRSIYYGALAYLGQLAGGFWLTVFVQGLAVAWLTDILLRAAGRRSLSDYAAAMAVLAFATSAPFFVADLMPDIWAGVAIGSLALLFAFPKRLRWPDRIVLGAMTVFAAMAHNSHVLIIAGMLAAGVGAGLILGGAGRTSRLRSLPWPMIGAGGVAIAAAVTGTMLFSAMVKHSVGAPPITPPFLTARVIADGPGRLYVREHCKDHPFTVCAFADRLGATDTDGFLWDVDPNTGVFAVATPEQRRALATEQTHFAIASTLAHPWMQAQASARNVALQLVQTDLDDFDYKPNVLAELKADLPAGHRARMERSLAARRGWPIAELWGEQAAVLWLAVGMIACAALQHGAIPLRPSPSGLSRGPGSAASKASETRQRPARGWLGPGEKPEDDGREAGNVRFALMAVVGVLANTLACGVLSDLYGRYQARAIWVLPMAAVVLALPLLDARRVIGRRGALAPQVA